jgi:hypothetical protein
MVLGLGLGAWVGDLVPLLGACLRGRTPYWADVVQRVIQGGTRSGSR